MSIKKIGLNKSIYHRSRRTTMCMHRKNLKIIYFQKENSSQVDLCSARLHPTASFAIVIMRLIRDPISLYVTDWT